MIKMTDLGALFSSVGRASIPCTEALFSLQRPWVRVPTWGPLLRVTPPLSTSFLSCLQLFYQLKAKRPKKKKKKKIWLNNSVIYGFYVSIAYVTGIRAGTEAISHENRIKWMECEDSSQNPAGLLYYIFSI